MIRLTIDIITDTRIAVPNPAISKESPINPSVIISVTALMTNRNNPSVKTVTGRVKIIMIGFTRMFRIESMKLAPTAAPNPDK